MDNYKCPVCGCTDAVEIALANNSCRSYYEGIGSFMPRGIIMYEGDVALTTRCETKVCTNCGFVSVHALELAKQVAKDTEMVQMEISKLEEKKKSNSEKADSLYAELDVLQKKTKQLEKAVLDENITVKKQKEFKAELEKTKRKTAELLQLIEDCNRISKDLRFKVDVLTKKLNSVCFADFFRNS